MMIKAKVICRSSALILVQSAAQGMCNQTEELISWYQGFWQVNQTDKSGKGVTDPGRCGKATA